MFVNEKPEGEGDAAWVDEGAREVEKRFWSEEARGDEKEGVVEEEPKENGVEEEKEVVVVEEEPKENGIEAEKAEVVEGREDEKAEEGDAESAVPPAPRSILTTCSSYLVSLLYF